MGAQGAGPVCHPATAPPPVSWQTTGDPQWELFGGNFETTTMNIENEWGGPCRCLPLWQEGTAMRFLPLVLIAPQT